MADTVQTIKQLVAAKADTAAINLRMSAVGT